LGSLRSSALGSGTVATLQQICRDAPGRRHLTLANDPG
jgi:hypothetical protein